MNFKRLTGVLAVSAAAVLLSGCVVAPIGARGYYGHPGASVYVEPAPIVVAPVPYRGYYGGGYHGRGYRGHGYRGHGYWR